MTSHLLAAGMHAHGANVDKLWLEIAGRPVVAHTWDNFDVADCIAEIVLVVRDGMQAEFMELAAKFGFKKSFARRWLGASGRIPSGTGWPPVTAVSDRCHPRCRPTLHHSRIDSGDDSSRTGNGAAVRRQPVTDTIKSTEDGKIIAGTVTAAKLWSVQTPQTFRVEVTRRALAAAACQKAQFTDVQPPVNSLASRCKLVKSGSPNPKVTVPADLPFIESLLRTGR